MENETEKIEKEAGYIKLMKSETSKGVISYAWDIKVLQRGSKEEYEELMTIISQLNEKMGISLRVLL
jgi:hypothetical protein